MHVGVSRDARVASHENDVVSQYMFAQLKAPVRSLWHCEKLLRPTLYRRSVSRSPSSAHDEQFQNCWSDTQKVKSCQAHYFGFAHISRYDTRHKRRSSIILEWVWWLLGWQTSLFYSHGYQVASDMTQHFCAACMLCICKSMRNSKIHAHSMKRSKLDESMVGKIMLIRLYGRWLGKVCVSLKRTADHVHQLPTPSLVDVRHILFASQIRVVQYFWSDTTRGDLPYSSPCESDLRSLSYPSAFVRQLHEYLYVSELLSVPVYCYQRRSCMLTNLFQPKHDNAH